MNIELIIRNHLLSLNGTILYDANLSGINFSTTPINIIIEEIINSINEYKELKKLINNDFNTEVKTLVPSTYETQMVVINDCLLKERALNEILANSYVYNIIMTRLLLQQYMDTNNTQDTNYRR